jgi:hypothetical protein
MAAGRPFHCGFASITRSPLSSALEKGKMRILQVILYIVLFFVFIGAISLSYKTSNYMWFSRSGALITVIPILISIIEFYSDREAVFYAKNNYGRYAPENIKEQASSYWPVKVIVNAFITIIGTLIWGFGDLIGNFL